MSESDSERQDSDDVELVPEDLQPSEDNPLAEPLPEDVDTDELDMLGGKHPEESSDQDERQADQGGDGESDDDA